MNRQILFGLLLVALSVSILLGTYLWKISDSIEPSTPQKTATASVLRNLKEEWKKVIQQEGGEVAYAKFLKVATQSNIEPHEQAHAFGEALYEIEGIKGLSYCDSSFEFGCYHSFFGVAVLNEGTGVLTQFSDACKARFKNYNLPCEHGIGHGVLVYTDYNLIQGLELCETISDLPTGGCSSGVFMEYNFHTMDESTNGYVRTLTENIYEPCDTLPDAFQASCFNEQIQWWQTLFNNDFKKIAHLCEKLTKDSVAYESCFHGTGTYIAAFVDLSVDRVKEQCVVVADKQANAWCHEGASWLVRGDGSEISIENAKKICNQLEGNYQDECNLKLLR